MRGGRRPGSKGSQPVSRRGAESLNGLHPAVAVVTIGAALLFGVCACVALPSPAVTSDLAHSEGDDYRSGKEKKQEAQTSERPAGGTREESPSLTPTHTASSG